MYFVDYLMISADSKFTSHQSNLQTRGCSLVVLVHATATNSSLTLDEKNSSVNLQCYILAYVEHPVSFQV